MYKKSVKLRQIRENLQAGNLLLPAIARAGIKSPYTVNLWRKRPLIDRYIKACQERSGKKRVQAVEDALFKTAMEGNTTAQIFFLTNRASYKWQDRRALVNNKVITNVSQGKDDTSDFDEREREAKEELRKLFGNRT